jgi:hypothetical protein
MDVIELEPLSDLHQLIRDGNEAEIRSYIELNPFERVVISNGESAIACALKHSSLDVYEILVANGFKLAPEENFEDILWSINVDLALDYDLKVKLRDIHKKYVKESMRKHLYKLIVMSKLSHNTDEDKREQYDKVIVETFEVLNANPSFEKILKYVSTAKGESLNDNLK